MVSTASPAPSCMAIEQEIQAKGLTAPRITPDHIESIIAQEVYFTAEDGAFGVAIKAKHTGG